MLDELLDLRRQMRSKILLVQLHLYLAHLVRLLLPEQVALYLRQVP
jgi:hypothetical protein